MTLPYHPEISSRYPERSDGYFLQPRILNRSLKIKNQTGLTLLEVLVALAILAIALTAIIKATAENIRATTYLQEKTIATWVGLNILNKTRLDLMQLPEAPEHANGKTLTLGQEWEWQGSVKKTANPHIREIEIKVFHLPQHQSMTTLTGYTYV